MDTMIDISLNNNNNITTNVRMHGKSDVSLLTDVMALTSKVSMPAKAIPLKQHSASDNTMTRQHERHHKKYKQHKNKSRR
jgi:hypothetical protein